MKRVLISGSGIVFVALLAAFVVGRLAPAEQVYAVADVQAGLREHPQAWIGRSILVRAVAVVAYSGPGLPAAPTPINPLSPPSGVFVRMALVPATITGRPMGDPFDPFSQVPRLSVRTRLMPHPLDPLLRMLRAVPLLAHLLPGPRVTRLRYHAAMIFRLKFLPTNSSTCPPGACPDAELEDVLAT